MSRTSRRTNVRKESFGGNFVRKLANLFFSFSKQHVLELRFFCQKMLSPSPIFRPSFFIFVDKIFKFWTQKILFAFFFFFFSVFEGYTNSNPKKPFSSHSKRASRVSISGHVKVSSRPFFLSFVLNHIKLLSESLKIKPVFFYFLEKFFG